MSGAVGEVIQEVRTRVRTGGISPHEEVIELRHMVEDILSQSTSAASDNESPQACWLSKSQTISLVLAYFNPS
jgi:hypothetical protein